MRKGTCACGDTFLIPESPQERTVFFRNQKPLELFFAGKDVGIRRGYLFTTCPSCATTFSLDIISSVISLKGDKIVVNWGMYNRLSGDCYIASVLKKLGILSGDASGNWIVMSQRRGCINPIYGKSVNLYFTSPDDATAYAQVCNVRRGCIMRIGDVITV